VGLFVAGEGDGEKLTNGETAHVLSVNEARERKFRKWKLCSNGEFVLPSWVIEAHIDCLVLYS
jgi:hypothetical protein